MVGQIVWAVVVAVLLLVVAVGWAVRGAVEVRDRLPAAQRRGRVIVVQPDFLRTLSERRLILAWAFLLALALLFLARSMNRGLPVMAAVVLSFTYAVLSAMVTGFVVWVRAQQHAQDDRTRAPEASTWSAWVGVGVGAVAVAYLVVDVATNLMA